MPTIARSRTLGISWLFALGLTGCPTVPTTGGTTDGGGSGVGGADIGDTGAADDTAGSDSGSEEIDDHRTYMIGETTKFEGDGLCTNSNLNTVTKKLRKRLARAGWSGLRLVNKNTWPEDFQESTTQVNGMDEILGDASRLSVYAGHGSPSRLQWGDPSDFGTCSLNISGQSRLGTLAGDTATAVMFLTSCTLRTDNLWTNYGPGATRQLFGYHNSPYIASGEPRDVFKRTQNGQSTKDAWLDEMEQNVALGKNSPVVMTMGTSGADAAMMHGATNLATGAGFQQNVGEPADAYFFEWLNNGCTDSCGGCFAEAKPPPRLELELGLEVPVLEVTIPRRSVADLAARTSRLVSILIDAPVGSSRQEAIRTWARQATRDLDVTYTMLAGSPRVALAYDARDDRLVVDNLDARDSARPATEEPNAATTAAAEADTAKKKHGEILRLIDTEAPGLLGVGRNSAVSVATREAGVSVQGAGGVSVPFEYIYRYEGEVSGYTIHGAQLEIAVSRHGVPTRIAASSVAATRVGSATIRRTPARALEGLEQRVNRVNPRMSTYQVASTAIAFPTPGTSGRSVLVAPTLLVDYVLGYGKDDSLAVARRVPVVISLVSDAPPTMAFEDDDDVDDTGDPRPKTPARK